MTTPSMTHPIPVHQAMGRALRMLLAALALVLLVTVAFMVGRVTVSSNTTPAQAPAVHTQAPPPSLTPAACARSATSGEHAESTTDGARGGGSLRRTAAGIGPWSDAGRACENLAVTSRVSCSELVGRDAELARLGAVLESVGQSSGTSVVLIGGEAGIGKTRLIAEVCARARGSDYLTAIGASLPVEGRALAYASPVGLLRDLERQLEGRSEEEALHPAMQALGLSSVPPTVARSGWHARRVVADSPHSACARRMAKTLTYEVVLRALADVSASAPLVVVFEDLQWADTFTLGLVDYLSRNITDSPILLIGSYRSDELGKQHPLRALLAELLSRRLCDANGTLRPTGRGARAIDDRDPRSSTGPGSAGRHLQPNRRQPVLRRRASRCRHGRPVC